MPSMKVRYETSRLRSLRPVGLGRLISTKKGLDVGRGGPMIDDDEGDTVVELVAWISVTDEDARLGVLVTELVLVVGGSPVEVMLLLNVIESPPPPPEVVVVNVLCREDVVEAEVIPE